VREYPDRGVVGWFYPKDASGTAAAVWFAKNDGHDGRYAVYLFDFDAIKPPATVPVLPATPPRPSSAPSATLTSGGL
jgi:hypothetical protein